MNETTTLATLTEIMRDVLDDPNVVLTRATTAGDVEGWDSMSNISFVVEIERRLGVKFRTAEIEEMHNVGDMLDMIATKSAS